MYQSGQHDDPPAAVPHPDTWWELDELGTGPRPYRPTFPQAGPFINAQHHAFTAVPLKGILIDIGVPGWLRPADALKLYELAYHCTGDILELGTSRGLSALVMASALRDAGRAGQLVTVELRSAISEQARQNLAERELADRVDFRVGDAASHCATLLDERRQFGLVFVDHSHAYEPMVTACKQLPELVIPGGFVVFHDFADRRNSRRRNIGESGEEYGVYGAVEDALNKDAFSFYGIYGCCGVFRRRDPSL